MSLPLGLSTVTVTCGPYTDATGAPYAGTVTFEPSTPVVWTATGQVVLEGVVSVTLGGTGAGQVTLPASDAAGLSPAGFTYRVSFNLTAPDGERTGVRYPFSIQLPLAAPSVVLDRLSPLPTTAGSTVSVPLGPLATMPVPGTPTAGQVLTATSGTAASWQAGATVSDATTGSKGIVQLAGDLSGTAAAPTVPGLAGKAADAAVVHNAGSETVAGVKTFSSAPIVPAGAFPESAVSGLGGDLAGKAPTSRAITAGTGLTGGGDLTADRTLTVAYGTTAGTAAQGNDARITGALQAASNLSDVASAATARTNLGLAPVAASGSAADLAAGSIPAGRYGAATVPVSAVNASGTPGSTTYLRGDGTWSTPTPGVTKGFVIGMALALG